MKKIKLNDAEKKVLTFWLILAVVIVSGLLIFKLVFPEDFDKFFGLGEYDNKYSLVKNRTRYYTVSNAIVKYYTYLDAKDSDAIFNILNDGYKEANGITSANNIKFSDEENKQNLTYNARLMCQKKINKGIYSFYVEGFESKSNVSGRGDYKYYEVILDDNKLVYSIRPIDQNTFGGECHE